MVKTYLFLGAAIVLETVATSSLKASQQFTRLWPTLTMVVCYIGSYYFLSLTLRHMSLGVAYAIWCALGIILVAVIGVIVFKQSLDGAAIAGLALIVLGVLVINLFSKAVYQH
ncbi:QacE family quaternary ammonium compound efflux SMR transporter [Deltaproteobacteria bacterium Smac51]|nr:QacE family quaternary ammonium compound efflux SMR transporter [Deltaproteobacteria bacterium Smac51]